MGEIFYRPTDVELAHDRYGAACGHAALAATLDREVCEVYAGARDVFAGRGYVSGFMMQEALRLLAPCYWNTGRGWESRLPARGLAWLQWNGPWMERGLPIGARMSRTHWVAVDGSMIYDINQDGWFPSEQWERVTAAPLMARHKGCTGWFVQHAIEVQPWLLRSHADPRRAA